MAETDTSGTDRHPFIRDAGRTAAKVPVDVQARLEVESFPSLAAWWMSQGPKKAEKMSAAVRPLQRPSLGYSEEIASVLQSLTAPDRCGCLVIGAAGIGKTTVMNAALKQVGRDARILRFRGSEHMRERQFGILEILLSQAADVSVGVGAAFSIVARAIAARSQRAPTIVLVDNADLVDPASMSVLCQLAEHAHIRLLVGAEQIRPPLDLVTNLWLSGRMSRVDLRGLDETAVAALVESSGRTASRLDSVAELHAETNGNPLLLSHVLFGRKQMLTTDRILWKIEPQLKPILEMIAMTGAIRYETMVRLCAPEDLDAMVDAGTIKMSQGRYAAVELVEPVVADFLRSRVRPSHSLQLWKRLDQAVIHDHLDGQSLFGYTRWGLSLGLRQPFERVFGAVGWANARGRYSEAAQLAEAAGHDTDELRLEYARAVRGLGDVATAQKVFDRVLESVTARSGDVSPQLLSRVASMDLRLTDPRQPERLRTQWVSDHLIVPDDVGRLDVTKARFEVKGGRYESGRRLASRVYQDHSCLTRHRLRAGAVLGASDVITGRVVKGLKYIDQAELMFTLPGMTSLEREDAIPQFFLARYIAGDWAGARRSVEWADHSEQLSQLVGALVDIRTGHPARALLTLDAILPQAWPASCIDIARVGHSARLYAKTLLGAPSSPTVSVTSAVGSSSLVGFSPTGETSSTSETSSTGETSIDVGSGGQDDYSDWADFEAQLFELETMALSQPEKAAERLYALGESSRAHGAITLASSAWMQAARLGHSGARAELAGAAAQLDGAPGRLAGIVSAAMTDGRPSALTAAAQQAADFGAMVLCSDLARIAQNRAVESRDPQAAKEARKLIGESLRAIRFSTAGTQLQSVLSDLERQVVDGIMAGRSSQELAHTHHLSVRTIEWHLGRIYRRLHVADRRELREVISHWGEGR